MSYFQDLSRDAKNDLRLEFKRDTTTDERRAEILTLVRDAADEAQMGPKCPRCQHHSFNALWTHALIEGHVYSYAGIRELDITGYCEFCFDHLTKEPDEDE